MNTYRLKLVPGAILLLALLLGALLLIDRGAPLALGDPPSEPPFAVLTEGDTPTAGLLELLPAEWVEDFDLDLDEARSATATGSQEVAVVPGDDAICVVSETVAGCATLLDAELGKLALVESCSPGLEPGDVRVTGLVPDAATTAAITRSPAGAVNVSASMNVYVETFTGSPQEITSAGLSTPASLPWDATDESLTTCVVPEEEQLVDEDAE